MSNQDLRKKIVEYMQKGEQSTGRWFCTWWFKFHVSGYRDSKEIRRELEKMEHEGLVTSDHSQSNNTKWKLVDEVKP